MRENLFSLSSIPHEASHKLLLLILALVETIFFFVCVYFKRQCNNIRQTPINQPVPLLSGKAVAFWSLSLGPGWTHNCCCYCRGSIIVIIVCRWEKFVLQAQWKPLLTEKVDKEQAVGRVSVCLIKSIEQHSLPSYPSSLKSIILLLRVTLDVDAAAQVGLGLDQTRSLLWLINFFLLPLQCPI